jgi:PAS domain S-box-containing protein
VKESPKTRTPSGETTTKERTVAVPVLAYAPYDSPLIDALMDGDSIHQLLVDSRGDYAIFMLDANGIVASWNKGAEQIKGYSRDEIVGRHFSLFYPDEDRARGKPERELLIAAREGRFEEEGMRVRSDGSEFWANVVISAVRDRADALVGFVKVTRDLTERRKEQERALGDAQALKAVNAELESFTYSVSHDLRAPIRQIEGFAKILEEHLGDSLDPQVEHYLHRIQEGSQQMGRLVDDLLHLAQLGRQHAKHGLTPLDALVDEVLTSLRAEILERAITCRVGALPVLECDPGLMKVVFTNLLSNAVKYTRRSERPLIEIGQLVTDGIPVIYVRDNGVGFDMKYADKLFGVFQRLHRTEDFEGAGVGLAIVSRIIRKHRGTIWAESRPDQGATFFFTLGTEKPDEATTGG